MDHSSAYLQNSPLAYCLHPEGTPTPPLSLSENTKLVFAQQGVLPTGLLAQVKQLPFPHCWAGPFLSFSFPLCFSHVLPCSRGCVGGLVVKGEGEGPVASISSF